MNGARSSTPHYHHGTYRSTVAPKLRTSWSKELTWCIDQPAQLPSKEHKKVLLLFAAITQQSFRAAR